MGKRLSMTTQLRREMKRIAILLVFLLIVVPALLRILADSSTKALNSLSTGSLAVQATQECSAAVGHIADVNEKNAKFAECTRQKMAAWGKQGGSNEASREPDARPASTGSTR